MKSSNIKIGQLARAVKNLERSEAWYKNVLRLEHLFSVPNMAFFQCGEVRLMLTENSNEHLNDSIIYFSVSDVVKEQKQFEDWGVEFLQSARKIHQHDDGTEEWMAFFNDPDGRPLGLMSLKSPD